MATKKKTENTADMPQQAISIKMLDTETIEFWVIDSSPMIQNAMSLKAKQSLLMPKGRKTTAEKEQNLKHDPTLEFISSMYRRRDDAGATRIQMPATAFKGALMNVALEVQGAKKTQIGRLVWVNDDYVDVYGIPKVLMSVVRMADKDRTPDIRTRAILPHWCCRLSVTFVKPTLNRTTIATLLSNAGMVIGVGDFRQEKGKGSYGQFKIASSDAEVASIIKNGGIDAQDAAIKAMEPYDGESAELLDWFNEERVVRGK